MGWQAVTLTYRATAPLLLGDYPLGFIQRTRRFIPGWTLWGALTAALTRAAFRDADGARYEAVGEWVAHNLLTSYAYLLVKDQQGTAQVAAPHFAAARWFYGPLPAAQFEARFVTSVGQTAIAPASLTAQTNTLHETESLSPYDLENGGPAHWQFTLYRRAGEWNHGRKSASTNEREVAATMAALALDDVVAILRTLSVGAERGYGMGRLERVAQGGRCDDVPGDEYPVPLDWDGKTLHAHVRVTDLDGAHVRGRAEAIPWRWWKNTPDSNGKSWGPGQQQSVQCFYVPGCVVEDAVWTPVIGPHGIWQRRGVA